MVTKNGGKLQSMSAVAVADPREIQGMGWGVGSSNDGFMHYVIGNIWSCVSQILCCVLGDLRCVLQIRSCVLM